MKRVSQLNRGWEGKMVYQTKKARWEAPCFVLLSKVSFCRNIIYDKPVNLWRLFCLHSCSVYALAVKVHCDLSQRHVFSSLIEALNCYCLRRRRTLLSTKLGTHLFSKNMNDNFPQSCEEIIDKTILKTLVPYTVLFSRTMNFHSRTTSKSWSWHFDKIFQA